MRLSVLTVDQRSIRGTDTNSLLRLFDLANEFLNQPQGQQERARADKALQRIVTELQKRKVRF